MSTVDERSEQGVVADAEKLARRDALLLRLELTRRRRVTAGAAGLWRQRRTRSTR